MEWLYTLSMKVAAYLRVSGRSQVGEGKYGLDTQRADIAAFCASNGHELVAEFIDAGVSGTKTDRPGFIRLLESAKRKEFAAVIVGKGDRLARLVKVDGYLRVLLDSCGVAVLSATERNAAPNDADGEMIEGMLAVVAQRARKDIVKRLHSARMVKAKAGGYAHGAPGYGFQALSKALVPIDTEQAVIAKMRSLRAGGALLKDIVAALNDDLQANPTRNGRPWQISTVAAILKRAA
jgi:DNA invertase Pin-like site-specific DNA recombinase